MSYPAAAAGPAARRGRRSGASAAAELGPAVGTGVGAGVGLSVGFGVGRAVFVAASGRAVRSLSLALPAPGEYQHGRQGRDREASAQRSFTLVANRLRNGRTPPSRPRPLSNPVPCTPDPSRENITCGAVYYNCRCGVIVASGKTRSARYRCMRRRPLRGLMTADEDERRVREGTSGRLLEAPRR